MQNIAAPGTSGYNFDLIWSASLVMGPCAADNPQGSGTPCNNVTATTDACTAPFTVAATFSDPSTQPHPYSGACATSGAANNAACAAACTLATIKFTCPSTPGVFSVAVDHSTGAYGVGTASIAFTSFTDGTVTCTTAPTNTPVPPTATATPLPALAIIKTPDMANLWICDAVTGATPVPVCPAPGQVGFVNGQGALQITEFLINGSGIGLGAFEFQVKFDHKIFAIDSTHIFDAGCITQAPFPTAQTPPYNPCADPPNTFLNSTGRLVFCTTVFPTQTSTENFIDFGCVSAGYNTITGQPIPGPTGNGPLARITIALQPDVVFRVRPGAKNGIVREILDENCEAADVLGVPLPGSIEGGLTPVCGDASITVRRLEGDVNGDCKVDIIDGAIEAGRFGAFFGSLLYDPFFDVTPAISDFDINIKDVQFVAGRAGGTCAQPLPAGSQLPQQGLSVGLPAS